VARGALDAAPLHAFRASAAGSGKSYLVDIASAVATGRICPTVAAGPKEEEQEKRLSGILQAGLSLASIDNLNGDLKGELLCQIVERPYVRVRPLGENLTIEVENSMVLCATGNQMRIVGDMNRRTVTCDLDAGMERPETRSFARDPVGEVMTGRARYVHAALTVVRAHLLAGCPGWDKGREELQSFGDWSRLVRGALVWLGKADPIETTRRSRDEDPDFVGLRTLLAAWRARFGLNHATGHTLREAIEAASTGAVMQAIRREEGVPLESTAGFAASNTSAVSAEHAAGEAAANLREALLAVAGVRGVMDLRGVGKWMSMHEKRIAGGLRFVRTDKDRNDVQRWKVSAVRPALMIVS